MVCTIGTCYTNEIQTKVVLLYSNLFKKLAFSISIENVKCKSKRFHMKLFRFFFLLFSLNSELLMKRTHNKCIYVSWIFTYTKIKCILQLHK